MNILPGNYINNYFRMNILPKTTGVGGESPSPRVSIPSSSGAKPANPAAYPVEGEES